MKKIINLLLIGLLITFVAQGQEYKKLSVFLTDAFDPRASITVEALKNDPLVAASSLVNALVMNGFKVISEKVARDKVEISNKGQATDTTFNQDVTMTKSRYLTSVYIVTFAYQSRADTGCGGSVISSMSGQIVDLASDGQIVATFSFKQGNLEGKCTSDVMNALARKLKSSSKKKIDEEK